MQTIKTIESGKNKSGFSIRIQQRGKKFDVVYCTGFCWKYIAKGISEQAARNEFFLQMI